MVINLQRAVFSIKVNPHHQKKQEHLPEATSEEPNDDRPIFDLSIFKKDRVFFILIL
jgi:CRISPR/Cas system CMR subunit Cmr6 (Cas7 group RAMP superfamily)